MSLIYIVNIFSRLSIVFWLRMVGLSCKIFIFMQMYFSFTVYGLCIVENLLCQPQKGIHQFFFYYLHNVFVSFFCSSSHLSFLDVYLFIVDRACRGGAEKERERERVSQAGSMLPAQSPMWGSNSWTVRLWPESKSRVSHLTEPSRCPFFSRLYPWFSWALLLCMVWNMNIILLTLLELLPHGSSTIY